MFFKKKDKGQAKADYGFLNADMHSHLLPGIDDGSPDLDTSIELVKGMYDLGYRKLITTPHILWDLYKNTAATISQQLGVLRNRLSSEKIDIEIHAAAEYFIDDHLGEIVSAKEPLLTLSQNLVLVEFSMASPPFEWKEILFEMQIQGYQPVIAHPERYSYLEHNKKFYNELKDAGLFFQLNMLSLAGYYGNNVLELARYLIRQDYYDLVGTDLHNVRHLKILNDPSLVSSIRRLFDSGRLLNPGL